MDVWTVHTLPKADMSLSRDIDVATALLASSFIPPVGASLFAHTCVSSFLPLVLHLREPLRRFSLFV